MSSHPDTQEMCKRKDCCFRTTACTTDASEQCGVIAFVRKLPEIKAAFEFVLWTEGVVYPGDPRVPHPESMRRILTPEEFMYAYGITINKFQVARVPQSNVRQGTALCLPG